jgi:hypothetical protein
VLHPDVLRVALHKLRLLSLDYGPAGRLLGGAPDLQSRRFIRQHEIVLATMFDVIDFLSAQGVTVDRFWVRNFVQRQKQRLCLQMANANLLLDTLTV